MGEDGITHNGQYICVDCRGADARLWSERLRAFAVACIEKNVNRVLIDGTDSDPEGHSALREALTTLILAGLPAGFRLTLVTNIPRVHAQFGDLQRDLQLLQIPARCFEEDTRALEWLLGAPAARGPSARRGARSEA